MTYCVAVKLEEGLIFAADSRTHAGVDNYATFCKMTLFEVANQVADAMRHIDRRDTPHMDGRPFNASFILGGRIAGRPMQLFRIYAEGNFIEAGIDTPFLQTGEAKYGKPIIDRVITPATSLADGVKCLSISFDSTLRSNLSVGMPIDLLCYERDSLRANLRHRFEPGDAQFNAIRVQWDAGTRRVFKELPELRWSA